jgi:hypothetical protein
MFFIYQFAIYFVLDRLLTGDSTRNTQIMIEYIYTYTTVLVYWSDPTILNILPILNSV